MVAKALVKYWLRPDELCRSSLLNLNYLYFCLFIRNPVPVLVHNHIKWQVKGG